MVWRVSRARPGLPRGIPAASLKPGPRHAHVAHDVRLPRGIPAASLKRHPACRRVADALVFRGEYPRADKWLVDSGLACCWLRRYHRRYHNERTAIGQPSGSGLARGSAGRGSSPNPMPTVGEPPAPPNVRAYDEHRRLDPNKLTRRVGHPLAQGRTRSISASDRRRGEGRRADGRMREPCTTAAARDRASSCRPPAAPRSSASDEFAVPGRRGMAATCTAARAASDPFSIASVFLEIYTTVL